MTSGHFAFLASWREKKMGSKKGISRAKHALSPSAKLRINSVEGVAKAGDGTKVDLFTGDNKDNGDELNTLFPLLSPVRRVSLRS
jgi:hypothetical protein